MSNRKIMDQSFLILMIQKLSNTNQEIFKKKHTKKITY